MSNISGMFAALWILGKAKASLSHAAKESHEAVELLGHPDRVFGST